MLPFASLAPALLAASVSIAVPRGSGADPAAPPETNQFAFLVGEWDCTTRDLKLDGSGHTEGRAKWTGYWILGGWAIQDDWESPTPDGGAFRGTNIRSFNPRTRKWDVRWLPAGTLQWKQYEAEKVGDTMVMIGGEGKSASGRAFVDRNVFHEMGADSWKWRKDRSFDGGHAWREGISFIECRRARPAP